MGAMGIIFFIKNFLIMVTFLKPKFQKIDPLEVSIPETVKKKIQQSSNTSIMV